MRKEREETPQSEELLSHSSLIEAAAPGASLELRREAASWMDVDVMMA